MFSKEKPHSAGDWEEEGEEGILFSIETCLSCFSVAVVKHPNKSSSRKKRFILAHSSRGIAFVVVGKREQTWAMVREAG